MQKVIFINHSKKQCGVYQYGLRVYNILKKCDTINYIYKEVSNLDEYYSYINENNDYSTIIYNYHVATLYWLNRDNIQKKTKNIAILHECQNNMFDITYDIDPNINDTTTNFSIPRPIFENINELTENITYSSKLSEEFINYRKDNIPIFSSFGFGFDFKGFDKIVKIINEKYDNAIIKLVIPVADFDNNKESTVNEAKNRCLQNNIKPNIKLMISHEFLSNEEILKFLSQSTLNIFLYDKLEGRGISSAIDYALSVKKPLAISDSCMFRNIYSDEICLYKTPINKIIDNSVKYCEKFLVQYSNINLINKLKKIIL
jgi:hypothetical protein